MKSRDILSPTRGMLIVLSGPSGVGKNTLVKKGLEVLDNITYSISATTRKPREGERDGIDYFFISEREFKERIARNEFLEWAEVYGNFYGTPRAYIESMLEKGVDVILDIDIQGAASIRRNCTDGVFIFIVPPSSTELMNRLRRRGTESEAAILSRISNVSAELKAIPEYDYILVNTDIEETTERLKSIVIAERCKVKRVGLSKFFREFEKGS